MKVEEKKMKNMINKLKSLSKKTKIIILISALCVVMLGVVSSVCVLNNVENNDKVAEKEKSSTKDKKKTSNDKDKSKEEDKKSEDVKPKEDGVVNENPISEITIPNGGTSGNGGSNSGNTAPVTPPTPPKVCSAPGVFFEDLPCDTILTQYNMNGWGVGNSNEIFATKDMAIDYAEREWPVESSKWYMMGYWAYSVQYNDGSQRWSVQWY